MDPLADIDDSPFHAGERAVQARLGVRGVEQWARKVVRPYLPKQHRDFHTSAPFLVIAARDEAQRPWATLLSGDPGFVTSPDQRSLAIAARPSSGDALASGWRAGRDVGILGIEFATARRNRVNGRIRDVTDGGWMFAVDQSFGNCPQHIRARDWRYVSSEPQPAHRSQALSDRQAAWIQSADTFFIASGHRADGEYAAFGMDASHRGGPPGFAQVLTPTRLVFPDYSGNNHFNTVGNLTLDPRVGLVFVDFETGGLLQLTGQATIDWSPDTSRYPDANRLITIDVDAVNEMPSVLPLRWDPSPDPITLRVADVVRETKDVVSIHLESATGDRLASFAPGQHLPIAVPIGSGNSPARRTYSLSSSPTGHRYRISVKRIPDGVVSSYLHARFEPGVTLQTYPPAGEFVLPGGDEPVVLIAAGIGVTPMLSMLHAHVENDSERRLHFYYGARDGSHLAMASEIRSLVAKCASAKLWVALSQPEEHEALGDTYDMVGRLEGASIAADVGARADYLLCGPSAFMASMTSQLSAAGVPVERIFYESFGAG